MKPTCPIAMALSLVCLALRVGTVSANPLPGPQTHKVTLHRQKENAVPAFYSNRIDSFSQGKADGI